jgi:hypothetical protein
MIAQLVLLSFDGKHTRNDLGYKGDDRDHWQGQAPARTWRQLHRTMLYGLSGILHYGLWTRTQYVCPQAPPVFPPRAMNHHHGTEFVVPSNTSPAPAPCSGSDGSGHGFRCRASGFLMKLIACLFSFFLHSS